MLGLEDVHGPHDVLSADRTLVHPLATFGAGDHVATLQEDAVDHGVHADPAEVVILNRQRTVLDVCKTKDRGEVRRDAQVPHFTLQLNKTPHRMRCTLSAKGHAHNLISDVTMPEKDVHPHAFL